MKKIPLTRGGFALVDNPDYDWLNKHKWYAKKNNGSYTSYAVRGIWMGGGKIRTERMHRTILGLQAGDGRQTDHRDGNGLNNCRSNLRICSHAENKQNSRKRIVATSQYKGVYWHRNANKWQSQIQVNKKNTYLGYFDSETDAALAYNQAALNYFGEFALLNSF